MRNNDLFSRILGVLVFLAGIAMLVYVFKSAHTMFTSSTMGLSLTTAKGAQPGAATAALGESAIRIFVRIILLLLMSVVASLVSSKGISLYFAATKHTVTDAVKEIKE